MFSAHEVTQILEDELVSAPTPHVLATGKQVVVFNLKITPKFLGLQAGNIAQFQNSIYEVMNFYRVPAQNDYLKFNFLLKTSIKKS